LGIYLVWGKEVFLGFSLLEIPAVGVICGRSDRDWQEKDEETQTNDGELGLRLPGSHVQVHRRKSGGRLAARSC
jgi:hypothetical protein